MWETILASYIILFIFLSLWIVFKKESSKDRPDAMYICSDAKVSTVTVIRNKH